MGALGREGCSAELCSAADLCQTGAVTSGLPGLGCAGGVGGLSEPRDQQVRLICQDARVGKAGRRRLGGSLLMELCGDVVRDL